MADTNINFTTVTPPGQLPKINSIYDFSAEALGQLQLWLSQNPPTIPISQFIGYTPLKSYTPTWTASTSNPSIGNGTLTGKYLKIGSFTVVFLSLAAGSTTTFGSGFWKFTYPVTSTNSALVGGSFQANDLGVNLYSLLPASSAETADVALQTTASPAALVSSSVPFTWGSGDTFSGAFVYLT